MLKVFLYPKNSSSHWSMFMKIMMEIKWRIIYDLDDDNDGFDDETKNPIGFDPFDRFDKPQMGIVTGPGEEQVSVGKYKLRARIDAFGDPEFTALGFVIGSSL